MAVSMFSPPRVDRSADAWETRSLRSLLTPRSERDRPDLPLLTVARERGVFVRSDEDANHNAIPDDLGNYKVARSGDLVINKMKAWQGSLGLAPVDGIVSPAYFVFEADFEVPRFGEYLLRSKPYVAKFGAASDGVRIGQWDLDISRMRNIEVSLPRADEQAAIAKYLAHANSRIGRAIAARTRLISLLEEQAREIVNRVVTKGLDRTVPFVDSGVPWIGLLPEHWSLVPARSIFKPVSRAVTDSALPQLSLTRSVGLVPSGAPGSGTIAAENSDNLQQCNRGDFVLNKYRAHLGLFRWCRTPGMVTRNYTVLKPSSLVYHDYFENLFLDPVFAEGLRINARGVGDGMSPLYTSTLMSMKMPLPPIEEQQAIVGSIIADTARLNQQIALTLREIELLQEFRTRLVADVVTGQVDVRGIAESLPNTPEQDTDLDSLLDDDLEDELGESEE